MNNFKVDFLSFILCSFFRIHQHVVKFKSVNYPKNEQFILAVWHAHQCAIYNVKNRNRLNVLISKSNDGEIIARATEVLGIKTIRGSSKRKGAAATFKLIEKLEQGENIAIMVDGPRGPNRVVKNGVINIAKISQVPIVPLVWYSPSKFFLKFKSWDEFRFPLTSAKTLALYGEPIYVPSDCDDEQIEEYRKKLEVALLDLEKDSVDNFDEHIKS